VETFIVAFSKLVHCLHLKSLWTVLFIILYVRMFINIKLYTVKVYLFLDLNRDKKKTVYKYKIINVRRKSRLQQNVSKSFNCRLTVYYIIMVTHNKKMLIGILRAWVPDERLAKRLMENPGDKSSWLKYIYCIIYTIH